MHTMGYQVSSVEVEVYQHLFLAVSTVLGSVLDIGISTDNVSDIFKNRGDGVPPPPPPH